MDFTTLLKGATDTFKKLETDVKNVASDTSAQNPSTWQPWASAAPEDDSWEDVTKTVNLPSSVSAPPATESNEHTSPSKNAPSSPAHPQHAPPHPSVPPASSINATAAMEARLQEAVARAETAERKAFAASRERDALRRARDARAADAELLRDKNRQIDAVLEEGEKLSIKIAEKEALVRTLKAAAKDRDARIDQLSLALSATEAKWEAGASRQRQLETAEKSALDGLDAAEKRLRQVESDARSKVSSSAALEAVRAQLESLRKGQATALENQAMSLTAEREAAVEAVTVKAKLSEHALNKAMMELRAHLTQVVDNAGWREDQLRKETDELRKRAEQLEARNEELAAALPDATRPLLRQVEALQAAASERIRAKSAVDRSQLERLRTAEAAVASASERERAAEERIGSYVTRTAGLGEQVKIAHAEHARMATDLRNLQAETAERQLKHQRELDDAQSRFLKISREKESVMEELCKERTSHLDAMEVAEEKSRILHGKVVALETRLEIVQESLAKAQASAQRVSGTPGDYTSPRPSHFESVQNGSSSSLGFIGSDFEGEADDINESPATSGVYATERLKSSLRQKSGEIVSLQAQLNNKETATKALAEEIINLTAKVDELSKELKDAPEIRKELLELKRRHTALLELLGEREERIMELEADLSDVNQIYKEQVTELLLRLEKLSS